MKLKLNFSKTRLILFSPRRHSASMRRDFGHLVLDGNEIHPADEVKILGFTFDSKLTFDSQIAGLVKTCNFALHGIQVARDYLPHDLLIATVTHEILSRLDYCNSLYLCLPKYQLYRLQKIMNRAARLIFKLPRHAHISPYLKRLHWLPIGPRIDYKIALITFKALRHGQPLYLGNLLGELDRRGHLQHPSSLGGHMISNRSFAYAAPRIFNAVPTLITMQASTETFKKHLKTYMFEDAFHHMLDSLLHYTPSSDFFISRH